MGCRGNASGPKPCPSDASALTSHQTLPIGHVAQFILEAPAGSVICLGGIDGAMLRELINGGDAAGNGGRRVMFVRLPVAETLPSYIEQVIAIMAQTATRLWPIWFTDVSFAMCRDDVLGRKEVASIAREAASRVPGVSCAWTEAAARLALRGSPARVAGMLPEIELGQLSRAISRNGLILVIDVKSAADDMGAAALAHALEWMAQQPVVTVVALFAELPPLASSFGRILHGSRRAIADGGSAAPPERQLPGGTDGWIAPWRGAPHPLSEVEQRLAAMLDEDAELSGLFRFNWVVTTVRGSRPKVDLVWLDGRLIVELDGYSDHTTRHAFSADRHRDYELSLSGYTVLRLPNDEVIQDCGCAIEKIRDLVRLRRSQMGQEA